MHITYCTFRFCPAMSIDGWSDWILPDAFARRTNARPEKMMLVMALRCGLRGCVGRAQPSLVRRRSGQEWSWNRTESCGWWIKNFHSVVSLCTVLLRRLLSALLFVATVGLSGRIPPPIDTDPLPGSRCHAAETQSGIFNQSGNKVMWKINF